MQGPPLIKILDLWNINYIYKRDDFSWKMIFVYINKVESNPYHRRKSSAHKLAHKWRSLSVQSLKSQKSPRSDWPYEQSNPRVVSTHLDSGDSKRVKIKATGKRTFGLDRAFRFAFQVNWGMRIQNIRARSQGLGPVVHGPRVSPLHTQFFRFKSI